MRFTVSLVSMFIAAAHAGRLLYGKTAATDAFTESEDTVLSFNGYDPLDVSYEGGKFLVTDRWGKYPLYVSDRFSFIGIDVEDDAKSSKKIGLNAQNELTVDGDATNWYVCEDFSNTGDVLFFGDPKQPGNCHAAGAIIFEE